MTDGATRCRSTGIRVANFGWVWAGPVVGQTLGFLGAEVYKIESRARIDLTRTLPPFGERHPRSRPQPLEPRLLGRQRQRHAQSEASPRRSELARELDRAVRRRDRELRPRRDGGPRTSAGTISAPCKPDLIMFSMPAAGLTGPLKDIRTYGLSLTSTTGLDSLTGYRGGPPIPVENAFSDPYNGIMGAFAILDRARATATAAARASTSTTRSRKPSCRWSAPPSWTTP